MHGMPCKLKVSMSRSIFCHNKFHLGDALQSLHLLRALAKANDQTPFVFFTHACNFPQLREVVADLPNIILADFESPLWREREHESEDMWKNHDHFWENSRFRWDWSQFMLSHHDWTAARLGFVSPFKVREHLLLDYPALTKDILDYGNREQFLIGDSAPSSGQYTEWADHTKNPMESLINALMDAGHSVLRTSSLKSLLTISNWGSLSRSIPHHIMVANAPFFCTLNTTNHHHHEGRKRIALLDGPEQLNMPHIIQMGSVAQVMQFAKQEGWL